MTVHGEGFSSSSDSLGVLTCRIGGAVRRAVWASSSAIVCNSSRFPLMIDPQGQANRFLKVSQAKAQLKTVKASDATKRIQQALEMGIRLGQPVLLENGSEVVVDEDYVRESILNPQAKIVEGYKPIMPTFQGQISEETLLQILTYIQSLGAAE